jgi:hypothetical protein
LARCAAPVVPGVVLALAVDVTAMAVPMTVATVAARTIRLFFMSRSLSRVVWSCSQAYHR